MAAAWVSTASAAFAPSAPVSVKMSESASFAPVMVLKHMPT